MFSKSDRSWRGVALLVLISLVSVFALTAQEDEVTIGDMTDDPASFLDKRVTITGTVTQFIRGDGENTDHYLLRGPYGAIIRVNTGEGQPELNEQYAVTGIVYEDSARRSIFISEQSRAMVGADEDAAGLSTPVIVGIAAAVLVAVLGIVFAVRSKSGATTGAQPAPSGASPRPAAAPPQPASESREEMATIRISAAPKTVKFIPGQLEILNGADKGKTFRLTGYPTENGEAVTVGRQRVAGERAHAHLQLGDAYPTVSRKQAEFRSRGGKLYLKNESETNPTQVDGRTLEAGEEVEISFDTVITMGELELKYRV